ncbi:MAG: hypothetical protein GX058_00410 [Firmicutes bacterium]|nr:hypothetical protein [Bacillota bacterium]
MKLGRVELIKLQKALDRNRKWSPVSPEFTPGRQARKAARHVKESKAGGLKRPALFDEPGVIIGESLDAVGLSFDGLTPAFLVRQGDVLSVLEILDKLLVNPNEAKYKIRTAAGRFVISRTGRKWTLEKQLFEQSSEE